MTLYIYNVQFENSVVGSLIHFSVTCSVSPSQTSAEASFRFYKIFIIIHPVCLFVQNIYKNTQLYIIIL